MTNHHDDHIRRCDKDDDEDWEKVSDVLPAAVMDAEGDDHECGLPQEDLDAIIELLRGINRRRHIQRQEQRKQNKPSATVSYSIGAVNQLWWWIALVAQTGYSAYKWSGPLSYAVLLFQRRQFILSAARVAGVWYL